VEGVGIVVAKWVALWLSVLHFRHFNLGKGKTLDVVSCPHGCPEASQEREQEALTYLPPGWSMVQSFALTVSHMNYRVV
jgi:hypothetical protein